METVYEREFILKPVNTSLTGFSSRSINKLVTTKQPQTILNIEVNHLKRDFKKNTHEIMPLLEYQLWLEAGKLDKANFKSPTGDPNVIFTSNMFRNFRGSTGLQMNRKGTVSEAVASLYPVFIPPPSQVGSNTLARYYEQNKKNIFRSDKNYSLALAKVEKEAALMKFLRLKSEMRNPPIDMESGNILPPKNFKKYPPLSKANTLASIDLSDDGINYPHLNSANTAKSNSNVFDAHSAKIVQHKKHTPSKLIFRENHPQFEKVILEQHIKGIYRKTPYRNVNSGNMSDLNKTLNSKE